MLRILVILASLIQSLFAAATAGPRNRPLTISWAVTSQRSSPGATDTLFNDVGTIPRVLCGRDGCGSCSFRFSLAPTSANKATITKTDAIRTHETRVIVLTSVLCGRDGCGSCSFRFSLAPTSANKATITKTDAIRTHVRGDVSLFSFTS